MKQKAQSALSVEGQRAHDEYAASLQQVEDLSTVTICNHLSHSLAQKVHLPLLIKKYAKLASLLYVSPYDLRYRFGYCMAEVAPLYQLAQIREHDSLDTIMLYIRRTKHDLRHDVEKIAWA